MLAQRLNTTAVPCVARLGRGLNLRSPIVASGWTVGQVLPMQCLPCLEEVTGPHAPKDRLGTVDLMIGEQVKFRGRDRPAGQQL